MNDQAKSEAYTNVLNAFIKRKKMGLFFRPDSANFNQALARLHQIGNQLEQRFGLSDVQPIRIAPRTKIVLNRLRRCGLYFHASLNGRKVFVKCFEFHEMLETEYTFCNRLNKINKNNFPEALFYENENVKGGGVRHVAWLTNF